MDVKEAVATAKSYFLDVFESEDIAPPTLEEVWFDENSDEWCVTMGLRRENGDHPSGASVIEKLQGLHKVDYKTIRISNEDGKAVSIRNRETEAA